LVATLLVFVAFAPDVNACSLDPDSGWLQRVDGVVEIHQHHHCYYYLLAGLLSAVGRGGNDDAMAMTMKG
jgi:hypothetical protein